MFIKTMWLIMTRLIQIYTVENSTIFKFDALSVNVIAALFQAGRSLMEYQNQAKQLFRKISSDPQPPARCSLESGSLIFQLV